MIKKSSVVYGFALSISGFLIAALLNALIPITADVEIVDYSVAGITIDINSTYRFVLLALSVIFLVSGLISIKDHDRWKKYVKGAPIRFASGIDAIDVSSQSLPDLLRTTEVILP